jgi:hypothetical protein
LGEKMSVDGEEDDGEMMEERTGDGGGGGEGGEVELCTSGINLLQPRLLFTVAGD